MSLIITFLKVKDLNSIYKKLIGLYILNVTDIIFTLFLINTGLFIEANYIMSNIININQLFSVLIKVLIPLILLASVAFSMRNADEKQLYKSNILINIAFIVYLLINISHILWITLYFVI